MKRYHYFVSYDYKTPLVPAQPGSSTMQFNSGYGNIQIVSGGRIRRWEHVEATQAVVAKHLDEKQGIKDANVIIRHWKLLYKEKIKPEKPPETPPDEEVTEPEAA